MGQWGSGIDTYEILELASAFFAQAELYRELVSMPLVISAPPRASFPDCA
uniref:Uncharacterized protein n=1 Tax=Curvibacter symbiont subsp. Hydra magnipapillata TaxID=667019 RepID=C9Y925_CURXX|nr:hypothetical protein Csp_A06260 [Curvibacter putative symbiont of Hydra magnipapillata]